MFVIFSYGIRFSWFRKHQPSEHVNDNVCYYREWIPGDYKITLIRFIKDSVMRNEFLGTPLIAQSYIIGKEILNMKFAKRILVRLQNSENRQKFYFYAD